MVTEARQAWLNAQKGAKGKKRPKFGNVRCRDSSGRWFDSYREMENHLGLECHHGQKNVQRQARLMYHDGEKPKYMYVDHAVRIDGRWKYYDTKGRITREWQNKADMLRDNYGIEIEILA